MVWWLGLAMIAWPESRTKECGSKLRLPDTLCAPRGRSLVRLGWTLG